MLRKNLFCNAKLIVVLAFIFTNCSNNSPDGIYVEREINEMKEICSLENKDLCIVLYRDSNLIFKTYIDKLESDFKYLKKKSIFNFVNISTPSNQWYVQWLCLNSSVATCVFSSKGKLKNVIGGASSYTFRHIEETMRNNISDVGFGYKTPLPLHSQDFIEILDEILLCRDGINNGRNIDAEIGQTLEKVQYPYNLYLKFLNSYNLDEDTTSFYWGNKLLEFKKNKKYATLYKNVFDDLERIVNPEYNSNSLGYLVTEKKIYLPDCRINEPYNIDIKLTNKGEAKLMIEEIDLGCDCIALSSPYENTIPVYESTTVKIQFTPKSKVDSVKHIFIISNAENYFEQIDIKANIVDH